MSDREQIRQVQAKLLGLLPMWNYRITKPFKQILDEGISLEMYYCIQTLRQIGGTATMSELGQMVLLPKQQMTKMVNRLVEQDLVDRLYDPSDRRIIRIALTNTANNYIEHFLDENALCFQLLLEQMDSRDMALFEDAIRTIESIFEKMPCACKHKF